MPPSAPPSPPLRLRIQCPSWAHVAKLLELNAQPQGLQGDLGAPAALGAAVEVAITLPDASAVHGPAIVCRQSSPTRPGTYFCGLKLTPGLEGELELLAQAHLPPPAPRWPSQRPAGPVAPIVGIDFGTSYSSLSVGIGDRVYLVPDAQGRTLHPSVVHVPQTGAPVVGWDARPMLIADPRRTVASVKRLLGRAFSAAETTAVLQAASFRAYAGARDTVLLDLGGTEWYPTQICAAVLGHLRALGQQYLGQPVEQVVLTIPASWGAEQTAALTRAAELARLKVVELLPEPVAGALVYGVGQSKNEVVGVYDFGGGTFDFSLVDITGDHFRILGFAGDAWLGGDDFDVALAQALANAFWRQNNLELRERAVEWQRLLEACEITKRALSVANLAPLTVEAIVETPRRIDLRQNVQRAVFEQLTRSLVDRSLALCRDVLDRVGLGAPDLTQVILTGGISRLPFVRDAVSTFFGRPVTPVVHPDEAVALGAGLRAAMRAGQEVGGVGEAG